MPSTSPVLVTGISGFVATYVALNLLSKGYNVRGTVRSLKKADSIKKLPAFEEYVKKGSLTFAEVPDVVTGDFTEALKGVEHVQHVASPFNLSDEPEAFLKPAIQGTENVTNSCIKAGGVKTLTITSSFAAVLDMADGFPKNKKTYSEKDWNSATYQQAVEKGDSSFAYCASKSLAEKKAYELVKESKSNIKVTSICPPMIFSPVAHHLEKLSDLNTSVSSIWGALTAKEPMPTGFPSYADTRDVAEAHVLAMEKGLEGRFLICNGPYDNQQVLDFVHKKYPEEAKKLGTITGKQGEYLFKDPDMYKMDNTRSKQELGLKYRDWEETFGDMVQQMFQLHQQGK